MIIAISRVLFVHIWLSHKEIMYSSDLFCAAF